jgi:hypothetical protein
MSAYVNTNGADSMQSKPTTGQPSQDGSARPLTVQPPRREDFQPSYASQFPTDYNDDPASRGWYGNMINVIGSAMGTLGSVPGCICCPNPYKRIEQGQVGLVTKFVSRYAVKIAHACRR